jgi:hypothetical protein
MRHIRGIKNSLKAKKLKGLLIISSLSKYIADDKGLKELLGIV